jgi:ligand-binding sensor domain-containing protein/signal transduction histidine kinase
MTRIVVGASALVALTLCDAASAERLPITTYTAVHGLAATDVNAAVEDAQGFLWIGSDTGLWRFDGWTFRNFSREQGLTKTRVTGLAISKDGTIWVGAFGGVFRFDAVRGSFVEVPVEGNKVPLARVLVYVDAADRVWCVGDLVFRLDASPRLHFRLATFGPTAAIPWVTGFLPDRSGNLWIAFHELYRVGANGDVVRARVEGDSDLGEVTSIVEDRRGAIWLGTSTGLCRVTRRDDAAVLVERVQRTDPARTGPVSMVAREQGGVWAGSYEGLRELDPDVGLFRRITREQGLAATQSWPLLVDRAGDLWLSGMAGGLQRMAVEGFSSFGTADGLESPLVSSIWRRRSGELIVVGTGGVVQRYHQRRFVATRPAYPPGSFPSWGWYQIDTEDRRGQWWIPTVGALLRFPHVNDVEDLAHATPRAIYRATGCFPAGDIFRVYEDAQGDIWVATINRGEDNLYRLNQATATFSCYSVERLMGENSAPTAFLDDGEGTLWIGFYNGRVGRYRNGRLECAIACSNGQGMINALHLDRRRRLWIANGRSGVLRVDDRNAARVHAVPITTDNGLSSNRVSALTEDRFGRIYVGTDQGIDVLDDEIGRVHHFGIAEGLPHAYINTAYADDNGDVWLGTLDGVAHFTPPQVFRQRSGIRVLLDRVRVSDVARMVSVTGESRIDGLVLSPNQRELVVDYVGLPRQLAVTLKFQYRLSEREPWSSPSTNRSLVLAGLDANHYRVEIRALDAAGRPSGEPARLSFRVLAPIYRRSWFIALAAASVVGLAAVAYRSRVRHLVALERQRTHIAMDLHDEMGSQLGSIALLADVAAEGSLPDGRRRQLLTQIADTAADMGSSLTEIVWSLRHEAITLERMAQYLTTHGHRLFPGPVPAFLVKIPETWPDVEMAPATGRNVLLVGLEAMHNCARHANAGSISLELGPRGRLWTLTVTDDGNGMPQTDPASNGQGFGLETMRRRAAEVGASLEIASGLDQGTSVVLLFDPKGRRARQHQMNIRPTWQRPWDMS